MICALGPERRRRLRRPARPRLRRLLGHRRLHRRLAAWRDFVQRTSTSTSSARLPVNAPGIHINFWLVLLVAGCSARSAGIIIGAPTLRLQERLPGAGHARLRRDHPAGLLQRRRPRRASTSPTAPRASRRSTRSAPALGAGRSEALGPFDLVCKFLIFVLLAAFVHLRLAADPRGPARPGLAGHPRGRAGRQHDGRPADADQALGLRASARSPAASAASPSRPTINGVLAGPVQLLISITLLAMVVLGGMGNVWGVTRRAVLAWINTTGLKQIGIDRSTSAFGTD